MKTPATSLLAPSEDIGVHASIDLTRSTDGNGISRAGDLRSFGINQWRYSYNRDLGTKLGWYIEGAATRLNDNFLTPTDPEDVTVSNVEHTISFYGGGSVDLSGVHTETITGEDVESRTEVTFTPSAGTLTITPSGTIEYLQLEEGAHASSPIGGDGVRAADDLTISDLDEISYNDSESTFIPEVDLQRLDKTLGIFDLRADSDNRITLTVDDTPQIQLDIRNGGLLEAQLTKVISNPGQYRIAVAWADGTAVMAVNGTIEDTDTYNNLPTVSEMHLGRYGNNYLDGTVLEFPYYSRRLDNADLQRSTPDAALQPTLSANTGFSTNERPVVVSIDLDKPSTTFTIGDLDPSNASLQNLTNSGDNQNYTVELVPDSDGLTSLDLPAGSYSDIEGNTNQAADTLEFVYDSTAPTISDAEITVSNQTETTAQFDWTKATDAITSDSSLVYRLYRALIDPEFPDDSELSTLSEIDNNGELVATGVNVASLSEDGTGIAQEEDYHYNVTVEDESENRGIYNQIVVRFVPPTVNDVTIEDSFPTGYDEAKGSHQFTATISAENVDNLDINWSSSNTQIATIDNNGLMADPVGTGEITIRAESDFDPGVFDEVTFTIWDHSQFVSNSWTTESA